MKYINKCKNKLIKYNNKNYHKMETNLKELSK